jgi:hypothetical protein
MIGIYILVFEDKEIKLNKLRLLVMCNVCTQFMYLLITTVSFFVSVLSVVSHILIKYYKVIVFEIFCSKME